MTIYFLGTGTSQGIPIIGNKNPVCLSNDYKDKRLRVSIWIYDKDFSFVIDCGPDFRQQMLISKCEKLDAILFTHEHSDHTAGLDDIRPFNFFQQAAIPIFAHERVIKNLEKRFDYIFETKNKYPGAPSVTVNEIVKNKPSRVKQTNNSSSSNNNSNQGSGSNGSGNSNGTGNSNNNMHLRWRTFFLHVLKRLHQRGSCCQHRVSNYHNSSFQRGATHVLQLNTKSAVMVVFTIS